MYHFILKISLYKCFWEHGAPISRLVLQQSFSSFVFFFFSLWFFPLIESRTAFLIALLIALGASGGLESYHADNEKWKADSMRTRERGIDRFE